jgi:hypothetical protein
LNAWYPATETLLVSVLARRDISRSPSGQAGVRGGAKRLPNRSLYVFLNVPYDNQFERLYLAFIAGLSAFGLIPRTTLEIPGGERRLDRIAALVRNCRYSLHDLSRVELDNRRPATPRFNMPFELGLAVAWQKMARRRHTWFVFETRLRRAEKSLSDLSGTDIYVHDGTVRGVFRQLCNALVRVRHPPTVGRMLAVYRDLARALPELQEQTGAGSLFEARIFKEIVAAAQALTAKYANRC